MGKNNNLRRIQVVKNIILPLFLLFICFGLNLAFIMNFDYSPTVLSYNNQEVEISAADQHRKITGEFRANDNYLGLIVLSFNKKKVTYGKHITFRIKEIGTSNWLQENNVKTDNFHYLPDYPFGFPIISDSQGKKYEFVIEIVEKNKFDSIGLSDKKPFLISKYQFPKNKLIKEPSFLTSFLKNKLLFLIYNTSYVFYSFLYLLPFIVYILFLCLYNKYILPLKKRYLDTYFSTHDYPFLFAVIILIYTDILFIPKKHDIMTLILTTQLIYSLKKYVLNSRHTLALIISILITSFFAFVSGIYMIAEKAALWISLLFIIVTIQMIVEIIQANKH